MLDWLIKTTGQIVGETMHQTGNLIDGTANVIKETAESVGNMPQTFMEGYDEELFKKSEDTTEVQATEEETTKS